MLDWNTYKIPSKAGRVGSSKVPIGALESNSTPTWLQSRDGDSGYRHHCWACCPCHEHSCLFASTKLVMPKLPCHCHDCLLTQRLCFRHTSRKMICTFLLPTKMCVSVPHPGCEGDVRCCKLFSLCFSGTHQWRGNWMEVEQFNLQCPLQVHCSSTIQWSCPS